MRARLPFEHRRALDFAEEAIIVDPFHRHRRYLRPNGIVADANEPGILIRFRVEDDIIVFTGFLVL